MRRSHPQITATSILLRRQKRARAFSTYTGS
jgi:hypothetical protein